MKKYVVYRAFTKKERPNESERYCYYGWSKSKSVVKAFIEQRSSKKYQIIKVDTDDLPRNISEDIDDDRYMIDFVKLRSAKTDEETLLFITQNELKECEMKIQLRFTDQASLSNIDGNGNYLDMFLAIDDYYADALYFIGYRPKEVDILFSSADTYDDYSLSDALEELIEEAYDNPPLFPEENIKHDPMPIAGLNSPAIDVSHKLYYSLESFIKVLIDDL